MQMNEEEIFEKGLNYYEDGEKEKAVAELKKIANINAKAQFCLGEIYWNHEIEADDSDNIAIYWYKKAAENGNGLAQLWLGNNYCIGIRSKPDQEEGFYWYKKASEQNMTLAQYHLAVCYATGWGAVKDEEKALYWMKKASENNFFDADLYLAEFFRDKKYYEKYKAQIDLIESKYFLKDGISEKNAISYALFLLNDDSSEEEKQHAFQMLENDPIYKNEKGIMLLADCYAKGISVAADKEKACKLIEPYVKISRKAQSKFALWQGK